MVAVLATRRARAASPWRAVLALYPSETIQMDKEPGQAIAVGRVSVVGGADGVAAGRGGSDAALVSGSPRHAG